MKFSRYIVAALAAGTLALAGTAYAGPNSGPVVKTPVGTSLGSADLWAVVDIDGTLIRSDGAASSANLGTGNYEVIFKRSVRGCVYQAVVGGPGFVGVPAPGFMTVIGRVTDVKGVFLQSFDNAGTLSNRSFHLFVNC
jgi:hypothetical protein